jgi:hypothetical protein
MALTAPLAVHKPFLPGAFLRTLTNPWSKSPRTIGAYSDYMTFSNSPNEIASVFYTFVRHLNVLKLISVEILRRLETTSVILHVYLRTQKRKLRSYTLR